MIKKSILFIITLFILLTPQIVFADELYIDARSCGKNIELTLTSDNNLDMKVRGGYGSNHYTYSLSSTEASELMNYLTENVKKEEVNNDEGVFEEYQKSFSGYKYYMKFIKTDGTIIIASSADRGIYNYDITTYGYLHDLLNKKYQEKKAYEERNPRPYNDELLELKAFRERIENTPGYLNSIISVMQKRTIKMIIALVIVIIIFLIVKKIKKQN